MLYLSASHHCATRVRTTVTRAAVDNHGLHRRESPPRSHERSAVNRHVYVSLHRTISHRDGAVLPWRGSSHYNRPRESPLHRRLAPDASQWRPRPCPFPSAAAAWVTP
ncbi:hypothetical protein E2542_SST31079 [Spatholobus suberectus]|nr:hypothetical protein E2542_SST31079 [Spatholobus suberectus]